MRESTRKREREREKINCKFADDKSIHVGEAICSCLIDLHYLYRMPQALSAQRGNTLATTGGRDPPNHWTLNGVIGKKTEKNRLATTNKQGVGNIRNKPNDCAYTHQRMKGAGASRSGLPLRVTVLTFSLEPDRSGISPDNLIEIEKC